MQILVQELVEHQIVTPKELEDRLARLIAEEREATSRALAAIASAHAEQLATLRQDLIVLAARVPSDQSGAVMALAERMSVAETKLSTQGGRIRTVEDKVRAAGW